MFQTHFTDCLIPSFFSTPTYTLLEIYKIGQTHHRSVESSFLPTWNSPNKFESWSSFKSQASDLQTTVLLPSSRCYYTGLRAATSAQHLHTLTNTQPSGVNTQSLLPKSRNQFSREARETCREYQRKETKREKRGYATLTCLPHRRWWGGQVGAGWSGQSSADFKITFLSSTVVHVLKFGMRSLRKQLQQRVSWSANDTHKQHKKM